MSNEFAVGQVWTYPCPEGFEESRIIIGAIEEIEHGDDLVCIAVTSAPVPRRNAKVSKATIPFLPFTTTAMEQTVKELEGTTEIPEEFEDSYKRWQSGADGMHFFQLPLPTMLSDLYYALQDQDGPLNEIADDDDDGSVVTV